MSSPHIDNSNLTKEQLLADYMMSLDFARETVKKNTGLQKVARELGMTDPVSKLLLRLYIMFDKFNEKTGLTSSGFRSAASANALQDAPEVKAKIQEMLGAEELQLK